MPDHAAPAPNYVALYENEVHGDFYGKDYYRQRTSDNESAIVYADGEDKIRMSAMVVTTFRPRRVFEVGCAMGLMVKSLRAYGVDAEGIDFSRWCIETRDAAVGDWVRWGDILEPQPGASSFDVVLALDVLEHLPPERVPAALTNMAALLRPGGIVFTVIPAYGPNEYGPQMFPLHRDTWRRDARAGVPFRDIPLDDRGKPHMGHLTHATITWWQERFRQAGLSRLGPVEQVLHNRYDGILDYGRRSFFVFVKGGPLHAWRRAGSLRRRVTQVATLPEGFWTWEHWGEKGWARWTQKTARDIIDVSGRSSLDIDAICNHPDIAQQPVDVTFRVDDGPPVAHRFADHDWHRLTLPLPRSAFATLDIVNSRVWKADDRDIGVGLSYRPIVLDRSTPA